MKIAVDAMGGDHAPESVVQGALLAAPQCSADLALVGDETRIRELLGPEGERHGIAVIHAPEVIGMEEAGAVAVRKKREASLSIAMRMLADWKVDAVVSAGNSSAIVAAAKHFAGLLPGLRRPALAVPIPTPDGEVFLIDGGAHAEADPIHLVQSAMMADVYLKVSEGLSEPRVGLLNIGEEAAKGTKTLQKAFSLLKRSRVRFVGNVEPQDIFADRTDAVICDGFVGNILLKFFEGVSEAHLRFFEHLIDGCTFGEGSDPWLSFRHFQERRRYQSTGGAPLLGVCNTVVVAHGRSNGSAVANAVMLAWKLAENGVFRKMSEELQKDSSLAEVGNYYALWMLERWRNKWGFAPKK
ncbi:MAG: phosphate acyltransferase PlsX [Syntrophobacteraceae bacterium]